MRQTRKNGAPAWMVTFADLMSLLLTFFILLLSFSNLEIVKFQTMAGSVRNAFGLKSEFDLSDIPTGRKLLPYEDPKRGQMNNEPDARQIEHSLEEMLREMKLEEVGVAKMTSEGVLLRLSGDLFFSSGRADLNPQALPVLDAIATQLLRGSGPADVIGHTDDVPIATVVYPSNWELSAARAGTAVRYLVGKGIAAERLRAIGYAETAPVAENSTGAGRAANRRVEFVLRAHPSVREQTR